MMLFTVGPYSVTNSAIDKSSVHSGLFPHDMQYHRHSCTDKSLLHEVFRSVVYLCVCLFISLCYIFVFVKHLFIYKLGCSSLLLFI